MIRKPKKVLYIFLLCKFFSLHTFGQDTKNDTILKDPTSVAFTSKGLEIKHANDFYLKFRFRTQLRAGYFSRLDDEDNQGYEAMVRRFRLRFEGYLISPKLEYKLQLSFANKDMDLESGSPQIIRDAVFYYKPDDYWSFGLGQTKLPGNRERLTSSGELQMPDRSIANAIFTIDRDFGIFINRDIPFNKGKQWLMLRSAVSTGEGRGQFSTDAGLAYTGRAEFLPLGKFTNGGDYYEGDLAFEITPKLSVGFTYSKNFKAKRTGGQLGAYIYSAYDPEAPLHMDMQTIIADAVFKYNGWAFLGEYYKRDVNHFSVKDFSSREDDRLIFFEVPAGVAYNLQASKMLTAKDEVAVRYTNVTPHKSLKNYQYKSRTKAIGYSHYFNAHKFKIQGYLGLDDRLDDSEVLDDSFKNRVNAMIQVEIGI